MEIKTEIEIQEIFSKLYTIVENNLKQQNLDMNYANTAFVQNVGIQPQKIEIERFMDLSNAEFAQAVYYACFQKIPTQYLMQQYNTMNKEEILRSISNEGAFTIRRLEFKNNPYFKLNKGIKQSILLQVSKIKQSIFLRKLAKKLPKGIQDQLRDLFC